MARVALNVNVFEAALQRLLDLYDSGDKVVVSFSGGKDSGVLLELTLLAAQETGNLPVDVVMRDEEIMLPGTFEYCERVAARPEVRFHWLVAHQPIINIFNREQPYFWVFDPLLSPDEWVRVPPAFAETIPDQHIEALTTLERFPPAEGKRLVALLGIRAQESMVRRMAMHSSADWITKHPNRGGAHRGRPIYDWTDGDVWKAIKDFGWDYNSAYDVMVRHGMPRNRVRIAPPTMKLGAIKELQMASRAFPQWFNRVSERCPGVRQVAHFGRRAVVPLRRLDESWEECFQRTCIDDAPPWIAERATVARDNMLARHARHSTSALPQVQPCGRCARLGSWKRLAEKVYGGDPFGSNTIGLGLRPIEPEYFRAGAGVWGGSPTF